MNNQKEYDFLRELTVVDDEKISEIASKYPMPDKSALNRINALCEEKLAKKENDNKNICENSEAENVEVICNIPWYRRPAFTAAACFAVLIGVTGGIMALFSGKSDKDNVPDNPLLTVIETTTAQSAETTTEEFTIETTTAEISAKTTLTKTNTKTTTANESAETTIKKTKAETEEPITEEIAEPTQPPETTATVAVITEPPPESPTETYTESPTEPPTELPTEESENDRILAMLKRGELPADADMNGVFDRTDIDIVLYYYAVCLMNPDQSYKESYNISEEVFNNIRDNFDYDNNGLVEASEASLLLTYWESLNK